MEIVLKRVEIKIDLIDSGIKSLSVTDDGVGMDREDAKLAFSRHATSKLLKDDDLFFINTLGFRGEALPSIASVSKVIKKSINEAYDTSIYDNMYTSFDELFILNSAGKIGDILQIN